MLGGGGLLKQSLLNSFFEGFFCVEAIRFLFSDEIITTSHENTIGEGANPIKTFSSVLLIIQSSHLALSSLWWSSSM